MPPPLALCFRVVRPSVRPKPEMPSFPPVHESAGPSDQPWPFCGMSFRLSVRPSVPPSAGEVSGYLLDNAWRAWPQIFHADVYWPPSELIRLWSQSVDFSNFGTISTKWNGSNLGVPGISWRTHVGNGLKFCILMYLHHLQNWLDYGHGLLVFSFWRHFDLVKRVKFEVSMHFPENARKEWPEILHVDLSWPPPELIYLWSRSVDLSNFGTIWLSEIGQIWGFRVFLGERMEGMACIFACCSLLVTFKTG